MSNHTYFSERLWQQQALARRRAAAIARLDAIVRELDTLANDVAHWKATAKLYTASKRVREATTALQDGGGFEQ